jgi:hypothetical protein
LSGKIGIFFIVKSNSLFLSEKETSIPSLKWFILIVVMHLRKIYFQELIILCWIFSSILGESRKDCGCHRGQGRQRGSRRGQVWATRQFLHYEVSVFKVVHDQYEFESYIHSKSYN